MLSSVSKSKMKRGKSKSQASVIPEPLPEYMPPLDQLTVKIKSIRITENTTIQYSVNVTFYDQLLLSGNIGSTPARATVKDITVLTGSMFYDPSDYERMSIISGSPLCVQIQPLNGKSSSSTEQPLSPTTSFGQEIPSKPQLSDETEFERNLEISSCNIDILALFIDKDKKHVRKRMQPLVKPSVLRSKSWDNLPLLNMKIEVTRDPVNETHHNVLKQTNWMKFTLIGAYNMMIPFCDENAYIAASRMPHHSATEFGLVTFSQGYRVPGRFSSINFNPSWENLREGDRRFTSGDVKFENSLEQIQNDDEIPLKQYLDQPDYTTIWGSFHRTLLLGKADSLLWKHIRRYLWPIEVHIYGESRGYSFMGFLNLFKLLYAGEDTVCAAVPLQWINSEAMQHRCGCELLLTPNEKASSTYTGRTMRTETPGNNFSNEGSFIRTTGSDDNNAFVLVEVKLARPLKKVVIPTYITSPEICDMLEEIEHSGPHRRECTGRGQQDRDWQTTVRNAAGALRKVPYYGTTEFCQFNRQLSETRTRVELTTSFWQDAAVYINNKFVVKDFLWSDETFEEMLMMGHACLMKAASVTVVGTDVKVVADPTLVAARHARQMQDIGHATELYLQVVVEKRKDGSSWRELSTCLRDVDRDWADVCINKAVVLDPRQPLTLLSKGCILFEDDPALAEPFFVALLALFPFWSVGWIIANAYYIKRELYHMADKISELIAKSVFLTKMNTVETPRTWEKELGDWWDSAPILSGMSVYYNAADLLLRLRCIKLAEMCLSLAVCEGGETAAYYHLVALCFRLQGNIDEALCHVQAGLAKYGEISYLRSLEAECYHKLNNMTAAAASFVKAGTCTGSYSILLSTPCREQQKVRTILIDLSRRQPSAYVWMALADDWMTIAQYYSSPTKTTMGEGEAESSGQNAPAAAMNCAAMCTIQALKWDRRAGRAWALLAKLVKPSARRLHCMQMAWECGYRYASKENMETSANSEQSICYQLGKAITRCNCNLCENTKL